MTVCTDLLDPRHRAVRVLGDRGYDAESIRQSLRERGILPLLAMRNTRHGSRLGAMAMGRGTNVCMAESVSPVACPLGETRDIHEAFLVLGCILICWRFLAG